MQYRIRKLLKVILMKQHREQISTQMKRSIESVLVIKYKVRCPNFEQSLIPNTPSSFSMVTAVVLTNLISKIEV